MKKVFMQLIVDFHQQTIPVPIKRDVPSFFLPNRLHKAFVLVGMRRSGKTWTLFQRIHQLIDGGLDLKNILYINFEDDRILGIKLQEMTLILDAYYELYPEMRNGTLYLFFDEIHEVVGWEHFIRRLLDNEHYKIYITGSSSKMLSKEIATSLRGRTLVREIFPYSFREFLRYFGEDFSDKISTKDNAALRHYLNRYLWMGGFPEVVDIDMSLHREILQGYVETVMYRDIVERYGVRNIQVLRQLLVYCLKNPASLLSVNKIYRFFKTQGHTISKDSMYAFMEYFEDAYCIFSVSAFNLSSKKTALIPSKIYPIDTGLITAYSMCRDFQYGQALESMVFSTLRRVVDNIYYFITKNGKEVDFFTISPEGERCLYQVCASLDNDETRTREISALKQAMRETGLKKSFIITMDDEEVINVQEGEIHVLALWKFLILM